jgi:hypothetical protein
MAAGKHGSNEIIIEFEKADSIGSADTNVTPYVTKFGPLDKIRDGVVSTPFGVSAPEYLAGVLTDYGEFTIEGFYDDTATTGPDAVFGSTNVVPRHWKITWGNGKYTAGHCLITKYTRGSDVGGYQTYVASCRTTHATTEA